MRDDQYPTRDALLSVLLRKVSAGGSPEGMYDAVRHQRSVLPGSDQTTPIASMVSWHESFHGFLNASTTYGTAMMLCGGLAPAGYPALAAMVRRMVDHALVVHETYATVASVCAISRGPIDPSLLDDYPGYQPFLLKFLEFFDQRRPRLSAMVLTSCARVAMQTGIYGWLQMRPCEEWGDMPIDIRDRPDRRFKLILTPESVGRAMAAVDAALVETGGTLARLTLENTTPEREIECLASATLADQDVVNVAAFESFAADLARQGFETEPYDGQKDGLAEILDKANQAGVDSIGMMFRMPNDSEDREALLHDFRNETLVFGDIPIAARVIDGRHGPAAMATHFTLKAGEERYLQLLAMPSAKARHLYSSPDGTDPFAGWPEESITFLRCARREGTQAGVDLMLLDGKSAIAVSETYPQHLLVFTASLNAIRDPEWRSQWPSQKGDVTRLLVLIDDDPYDLLARFARRDTKIRFAGLTVGIDAASGVQKIELLCIAADDEPALLYVTPMSGPFREAIVDVALRTVMGSMVDKSIIAPWVALLSKAIPHWVNEERQFGTRIWE